MQSIEKKNNLTVFYKSLVLGGFFCFVIAIFFIHLSYFCCCCCFSLLGDLICFVVAVKRYIHSHIKSISIERNTRQQTEKPHYLQCFFTWQTGNRKHFFQLVFFSFWICIWRKTCFKKDKLPFRDDSLVRYVGCSGFKKNKQSHPATHHHNSHRK